VTLSHISSVFNIDKCKIYPLTADPSGGSPTYGSGIAIPGIRELTVTFDILSKELYGDAKVLVQKNKVRKVQATANNAQLNLDAYTTMLGGAVTDSGTTPNQKSTWKLKGASQPSAFKLEAQILAVDFVAVNTADAHIILWKCVADAAGLGGTMEDFNIPTLTVTGTALYSTDDIVDVVYEETAVALT
jgi:hypothetical protein